MKNFNILVCSTIKILHDLSLDRREPDRILFTINFKIIVRKDFILYMMYLFLLLLWQIMCINFRL